MWPSISPCAVLRGHSRLCPSVERGPDFLRIANQRCRRRLLCAARIDGHMRSGTATRLSSRSLWSALSNAGRNVRLRHRKQPVFRSTRAVQCCTDPYCALRRGPERQSQYKLHCKVPELSARGPSLGTAGCSSEPLQVRVRREGPRGADIRAAGRAPHRDPHHQHHQ